MDIGSFLGGRYLGAADLPQTFQIWTIQTVGQETVDGQPRICVKFFEHPKPYLANKTNLTSLAQTLGRESQHWINQRIEVTKAQTTFQGRSVQCVRLQVPQQPAVQPLQPQGAWQPQPPTPAAPIPPSPVPPPPAQPQQPAVGQQGQPPQQPTGVVASPGAPAWGSL